MPNKHPTAGHSAVGPRLAACLALLGLLWGASVGSCAEDQVVWGQEVFLIPYKWSGGADRSAVREVVLYLSQDKGAHWSEVTRARPDVQSFMYRAPRDGEYWFAIRTQDTRGVAWPQGQLQAELRVVVDTVLPVLAIQQATLSADGRLAVEATANDPQLDPSSLKVTCQDPTTGAWKAVVASVEPSHASTVTIRAHATLPRGVRSVAVRVTALDRAGNPASAGVVATVQGGAFQGAVMRPASTGSAPRGGAGSLPPDPFASSSAFSPTAGAYKAPQFTSASQPAPASPPAQQLWLPDNRTQPKVAASRPSPPRQPEGTGTHFRFASNSPVSELPRTGLAQAAPQKLLVNSNRFELQYDLQSVGRWGVSKVEVWGTEDQGRTWRSFAVDTDQRSPVDVETPGEGLYGFSILVQSVGGLERDPPRPGDKPEVYVEVDQSRPSAALLSAQQPDGYFADHLIFAWRAGDPNLTARPVSLLYAARPSGPWMPITSNLENSGRYSWRLQRHLPSQVYLRLEVRDQAGNVGIDQSTTPLLVRLPQSSGQILNARPVE